MKKYLYSTNFPILEKDLALMEEKALFGFCGEEKEFFSDIKISPSDSAFLRGCLEILFYEKSFEKLMEKIREKKIVSENFKVEYFRLDKENIDYETRLGMAREIGMEIIGTPNMKNPEKIYSFTKFQDLWFFGIYEKNNLIWLNHIDKPFSYSNSLGVKLAKSLLNIASSGDKTKKIIDPCSGVGTIVLEGLSMGYNILGYEINKIIAQNGNDNLVHYGYSPHIIPEDMLTIKEKFNSSILDIPYGIFSHITVDEQQQLINKCREISEVMVLVSFENLETLISNAGFNIIDSCTLPKGKFKRYIYLCE